MNEEAIKRVKEFLKQVHGISDTQIDKYFASDESSKDAIETAKAKQSDSYDEGLEDGTVKIKKSLIKSIKDELGIEIKEKDIKSLDDLGKLLKPKVEEKFKVGEESKDELVIEWKKKYDDAIADKDKEVLAAQTSSKKQIEELRRDSLAKDILKEEGYNIPTDTEEYQTKLEMVKSIIEKKGWNYELDTKDNNYYRIKEDGTKERNANKPVTFADDIKGLFNIAFGKSPAEGKEGGIGKEAGAGGEGGEKKFDWSPITRAGFTPPTTKEEAKKLMTDPLIPLGERVIFRDYLATVEEAAV